jgi:tetratricopeptide (TPR) repeat protein
MKKIFVIAFILIAAAGCTSSLTEDKSNYSYNKLYADYKEDFANKFMPESYITHYHIANTNLKNLDKVDDKRRQFAIRSIVEEYSKAIELNPAFHPAYYGLGIAYLKAKNYKKASKILEEAVKLSPEVIDYHLALAYSCEKTKDDECFTKEFAKVIEIDPTNIDALIHIGNINLENKHYNKALGIFKSILEVDPENLMAQKAVKSCKKHIKKEAQNTSSHSEEKEVSKKASEEVISDGLEVLETEKPDENSDQEKTDSKK